MSERDIEMSAATAVSLADLAEFHAGAQRIGDMFAADWTWLANRNARIRFHSDGTASVMVNGKTRRRDTLKEAVEATRKVFS